MIRRLMRLRSRFQDERNDALAAGCEIRQTSSVTVCPDRLAARFLLCDSMPLQLAPLLHSILHYAGPGGSSESGVHVTDTWRMDLMRNIQKHLATSFLTIGFLSVFATSLEAGDLAYMLAETGGASNQFGTVDLQSGAFTLIGNMGAGTYAGLGVADGVLYTEQNGGLYSVNITNASLTLIGGTIGNNIPVFGSTTSGLYGIAPVGSQSVPTLFSINSATGAVTSVGAVGVIPNGGGANAKLSTGSSTLYMENNGSLYTMSTTTGAATLVGTESGAFPVNALLFENGNLYVGANGFGVGTISVSTGEIAIHFAILGGPNFFGALAPDPLSATSGLGNNYYLSQFAFSAGWQSTLTLVNYSPQQVTCTTSFYSDSGSPLPTPFGQGTISTRTDTMPPGGSVHDQTTASLAGSVAQQGWAQASCTGPVQASLLFRFYSSGVPAGEAGVNAETAPTTKFATFAQTNTGIAYANPSTTDSATITITVYSSAGTQLGSKVITLGPLAHGAANLGGGTPGSLGFANFTGFVKITSTLPIISLSLNAEAFPAFSALPPGDLPGSTVLVP